MGWDCSAAETATFRRRRSTGMGMAMRSIYEVRSGRRAVAHKTASTAHEALFDYLRGLGCRDSEIVRMGDGAAAWRGAIYSAVPAKATNS
jgi:hypothetical protein